MDKKRIVIVCGLLMSLLAFMLFIDIDESDENINTTDDEVIYLGIENPKPTFEQEVAAEITIQKPEEVLTAELLIEPDLGRLAMPSVLINKKSATLPVVKEDKKQALQAQQQNDLAYKIFQGHRFNAVLTHAIHSDLPGMVIAQISQDIYGYQSSLALLPTGTRLIGNYNNRLKVGDSRLFINWERAITPDGVDIELESIGTDRLGQSGLTGVVDRHFWETFGTSSLLSVMAVGASNLSSEQGEFSNQYQQAVTESLIDTSGDILSSRIGRPPTIHIPQGTIVHVVVAKDLDFSQVLKQAQKVAIF